MPQEGDVIEGRYRITSVLATGGMGLILEAEHLRMGRQEAVKVLHSHIAQEAERDGYSGVDIDVTTDSEPTLKATLEPVAKTRSDSKRKDRSKTKRRRPKPADDNDDESVDKFLDEMF